MRILTFTQITDDRFEDNIQDRLLQRVQLLKTALNALPGVTAKTTDLYEVDFGDSKQCRCDFYVEKDGRKTTWDDVYKMVNAVQAVPYKLVNISDEITDTKLPEITSPISDEKAAHLFFYSPAIIDVFQPEYAIRRAYSISDELINNREFILDALRKTPNIAYAFCNIPDELQNDKEFMLKAININGNMRMVASEELHKDKDIALLSVSKFGITLQEFPAFQDDKDVVMTAVQKNGMALQFASPKLQDDIDVVRAAIKQNPDALNYASMRICWNHRSLLEEKPSLDSVIKEAQDRVSQSKSPEKDAPTKDKIH